MTTTVKYRPSRVAPPPEECPLTECMALLGGAWTPNIVWYLREGPRRFNELRGDVAGVSAKVLSQRLQRLQADGIVERRVMPTKPPTVEYELTELGRELLPAVDAIVEVGHRLKRRRGRSRGGGAQR
ncbi:MAG TPA: helix-turn-helix domain-containing protein [Solirubrobacter sp.]|nr:helix-turn-helix domain-containing protein [Solirubrobacter sp.]